MNSEQQHELAQNDLERLIGRTQTRYAHLIETHGNRILLWTAMVLLLIAASVFYFRTSRSSNAEGWSALMGAESPEDLAGVAEAYSGTAVGDWAALRVGEEYLQSGIQLLFTDREGSAKDLEEAQKLFEKLLNTRNLNPAIQERALFSLARTQEASSQGDLKPAIETYQKLLQDFPETPYKDYVEKQIAQLQKPNVQEFYAWFAEQKPEPKDRELPADLQGGMNLNFPPEGGVSGTDSPAMPAEETTDSAESPESASDAVQPPVLSVPGAPDFPPSNNSAAPEMKTEQPATPEAATPEAAPADAKPAETKLAEETPSPETKPAPEKPASEQPATPAPATESPVSESPAPESTPAAPAAEPATPAEPTPAPQTPSETSESPAPETSNDGQ